MPSLFIGFGIALGFKELGWKTGLFTSGLGAQLTWTLPFGLMITFATIGRFDRRYEEAATDLGARRLAALPRHQSCRSSCRASLGSGCSASRCPTTSSPVPR